MPKCELLVTTTVGEVLAGTVTLSGGQIATEAKEGYEALMRSVVAEPIYYKQKYLRWHDDLLQWLEGMPHQFNGTHLRARVVYEDGRTSDDETRKSAK